MKSCAFCMLSALFFAIAPRIADADNPASDETTLVEDGSIEIINNFLAVKLRLNSDAREFDVRSPGADFDIQPNASVTARIAVSYRFLSLSYGYIPGFLPGNGDEDLKGSTKARSYSLEMNLRHWIQSLSYDKVDGFHLGNTGAFVPGWVEGTDPYIQFPELEYTGFQGFTAYKFNPRFSFKALRTHTERQRKSAGSLVAGASYHYYIVDNKVELTAENSSQKTNNFEAMLSLGYSHTLVSDKNFYVSAGLFPAAGMIYTTLLTRQFGTEFTDKHRHPIYRLEAHGALGYSSRRFFIGTQVIASWARYSQAGPSNVIVNKRLAYQFFTGYRFDAPGILARLMDSVAAAF